jgi:hypothetical protein
VGGLIRAIPLGAIMDLDNGVSTGHDLRGQLDFNRTFLEKQEFSAIAGYEVQSLHVLGDTYRLYGYDPEHAVSRPVDGLTVFGDYANPNNAGTIPLNLGESDLADRYRSYYANAAWTYNGRLSVSGSGRLDQSNLFGVRTNQKGVPLWSAGAAWTLSKEGFYHISWLPYLKLRATFGYNGNINKSLSAYTTASYLDGAGSLTRLPYAQIINPPNPGLRWERVRNINFGLDFGALNGRLSGTLEYFLKKGIDLIGNTAFPPSSGISTFTGNTANTSGHGLDFNVTSKNFDGRFNWTTDFFISYVADKVTQYDQVVNTVNYLSYGNYGFFPLQGKPLFAIYSYRSAGLDNGTGDPQGYLDGAVSKDYAALLKAATPQNIIYNGSSRPVVFGSFRNTFGFGGLSLSANITYELGYYFRRNSVRYGYDYGLAQQSGDFARRWQQPGDELRTTVPSIPAVPDTQRDDFYTYSPSLVDKGDNFRLQDLRLDYTFPKGVFSFLGNNGLQVYLYAVNLGILWRANKDHIDPDYPNNFPAPRTIAGGIRLNLNTLK